MEKAFLCQFDCASKSETGNKIMVQFNPATYSISGGNSYDINAEAIGGGQRGFVFSFTNRQPSVLSIDLTFDSYQREKEKQEDVREKWFTDLGRFLQIQPSKHTPMALKFAWGTLSFVGVITDITENYTMFGENGKPVRAKLTLKIKGCRESELVTSANESPDRTKLRTACQKDTLWSLSQQEYGSGEQWRVIALANGIENPRKLQQAARLVLPALPGGENPYG